MRCTNQGYGNYRLNRQVNFNCPKSAGYQFNLQLHHEKMADNIDDSLLFIDFLFDNARDSDRVVLERENPFDDYDDRKFKERFRLSKATVKQLLVEVSINTYRMPVPECLYRLPIADNITVNNVVKRVILLQIEYVLANSLACLVTARYVIVSQSEIDQMLLYVRPTAIGERPSVRSRPNFVHVR